MHGALQKGALATTFTASQGLLLMIPNMFKIAGELTPAVIHVAARAIATHALSIFGDHSDVMHARATGWAMLAAGSVQEAHDFALVAHAATLRSRVPFLHFFDGFRTSHEINKIALLERGRPARAHPRGRRPRLRRRGLTPEAPVVRGTAQNPDVFFQAREACNPYHLAVPGIVQTVFDELAARTGRAYHLVDYHGAPDAERVDRRHGLGGRCGRGDRRRAGGRRREGRHAAHPALPPVPGRRGRRGPAAGPFAPSPCSTGPRSRARSASRSISRWSSALVEAMDGDAPPFAAMPRVIGGRYGLSSKEVTPSMIKPVFDELAAERPRRHFTVGIYDDVTNLSLPIDAAFRHPRPAGEVQALFFGLGSDGTVGANKASVKIIGEGTDLYAQGYFVYDSKKSGSMTTSHLRFGPEPIRSTYLVDDADFVACHQFGLLENKRVLELAKHGATFLLNAPYGPDEVWDHLSPARPAAARREGDRPVGDRRVRRGRRGRHGQPHQHRDAAVLLPAVGRAARPTRRSPGSRTSVHEDVRQAWRGGRPAQLRRHRPIARADGPRHPRDRSPRPIDRSRRSSRTRRPTSCSASRPG